MHEPELKGDKELKPLSVIDGDQKVFMDEDDQPDETQLYF
jgi:hypothetical protein